jgi:DNA-binding HxlR family transcriptional regulator
MSDAICIDRIKGLEDAKDILSGKWKMVIICTLSLGGKKRFMELQRDIDGIGAKMLSRELKDLEINRLITRTVVSATPLTVEYELTEYGATLVRLIMQMADWGATHRRMIMQK